MSRKLTVAKINEAFATWPLDFAVYLDGFVKPCVGRARGEDFSAGYPGAFEMLVSRSVIKDCPEMQYAVVKLGIHKSHRRRNFAEKSLLRRCSDLGL